MNLFGPMRRADYPMITSVELWCNPQTVPSSLSRSSLILKLKEGTLNLRYYFKSEYMSVPLPPSFTLLSLDS